jgi:hypothetical protein
MISAVPTFGLSDGYMAQNCLAVKEPHTHLNESMRYSMKRLDLGQVSVLLHMVWALPLEPNDMETIAYSEAIKGESRKY